MKKRLSIGFAHHDDFDGAWFTIQDIRKELIFNGRKDLLDQIEFVIVENNKSSSHADELKKFVINTLSTEGSLNYNIISTKGTGIAKNEVIKIANGEFVLLLDCHVLLCPVARVIDKIFKFMDENPETSDLYSGPLVYDNGVNFSTHFVDVWSGEMWGSWSTAWRCKCNKFFFDVKQTEEGFRLRSVADSKLYDKSPNCDCELKIDEGDPLKSLIDSGSKLAVSNGSEEPFEIFGQGTGCLFVRKEAWLGYNEHARGFGGEECYIHEKFRKSGNKAYCLPFLMWLHRFARVNPPTYPLETSYKLRNYILEFTELNLDLSPVYKHFVTDNGFDEIVYNSFVREAKYLYNRD